MCCVSVSPDVKSYAWYLLQWGVIFGYIWFREIVRPVIQNSCFCLFLVLGQVSQARWCPDPRLVDRVWNSLGSKDGGLPKNTGKQHINTSTRPACINYCLCPDRNHIIRARTADLQMHAILMYQAVRIPDPEHFGSRELHAHVQRETSTCEYRSASSSPISHPLGESGSRHSTNHSLPDSNGRLDSNTRLAETMGSTIGYDGNDKYLTYIEWDKEVRIGWLFLEGMSVLIFWWYNRVVQGVQVIFVMVNQIQAPVIFQAEDKATFHLCRLWRTVDFWTWGF